MDLPRAKIPAVVTAERGESPLRRRGQGSPATMISWGLAGPKAGRNSHPLKGKRVNIPVPQGYASRQRKPSF